MPDDALRLATLVQEELDVARIVDVSPETLVIETTGTEDKIDSLLEVLRPYRACDRRDN